MQVSLRIQKVKSSALAVVQKHNEREEVPFNARPNPKHKNLRMVGGKTNKLSDLVLNRIKKNGATISHGKQNESTVAVEIVLSASPEYFRENPEDWGQYNVEKTNAWLKASKQFLKDKYQDNLVCLDLHLDEATPHLHAIVTPLVTSLHSKRRTKKQIKNNIEPEKVEKTTLNASKMFNKEALILLQTEAAKSVSHLGIQRGRRNSGATHQTLKEFYKGIKKQSFNIASITVPTLKKIDPNVPFNPLKISAYVKSTNSKIKKINNQIKSFDKTVRKQKETISADCKDLLNQLSVAKSEIDKLQEQNTSLKEKNAAISKSDKAELMRKIEELTQELRLLKSLSKELPSLYKARERLSWRLTDEIAKNEALESFLKANGLSYEYRQAQKPKKPTTSNTEAMSTNETVQNNPTFKPRGF